MINNPLYTVISNITKGIALLIVALSLSVNEARAQKVYLKVTDHHDNSSIFIVDENLNIVSDGTNIMIHSSKSDISMNISDLKKLSYTPDIVTAISDNSIQQQTIEINDNYLKLNYPDEKRHSYHIIDLNATVITENNFFETAIIQLNKYCKGVYILKIDNLPAIKFFVR